MNILIVLLKSVIILILNIVVGYGFVWLIKFLLIFPSKEKRYRGKRIWFTPGYFVKIRNKYFNKISDYYYDYMKNSKKEDDKKTIIAEWEEKSYHFAWDKTEFVEAVPLITVNFKANIRHWMALLWYEFVKQFLRTFVPFILEKFKTEEHLMSLDKVTSPKVIQQYYNKYIHKFLLIFFLIISAIVGVFNMIFFVIVQ
ncbi:MAG: hypothetical protein U9N34_06925 [Candidatus Cloacimonadota bacterium]|nr:hypothetical protein [Candidatus Cloacimonadota bacterium]